MGNLFEGKKVEKSEGKPFFNSFISDSLLLRGWSLFFGFFFVSSLLGAAASLPSRAAAGEAACEEEPSANCDSGGQGYCAKRAGAQATQHG